MTQYYYHDGMLWEKYLLSLTQPSSGSERSSNRYEDGDT